jgi:hypothetical protein
VRAEVTAFDGALLTENLEMIIRKQGDNRREAVCCRNTAAIVAGVLSHCQPNSRRQSHAYAQRLTHNAFISLRHVSYATTILSAYFIGPM